MAQPTRRTRTKTAPAAPEPAQEPKKARPTIELPGNPRSYDETEVTAMIQPAVRDKWLAMSNRSYDLKQVKAILDGTNSNRIFHMMSLFEVMEDTWPRLGKASHEIRTSVTKLDFHFEAFAERGAEPTPEAQARAAFVEDVIRGMKGDAISGVGNFEQMLYDILDAYGKGVAVLEPLWVKAKDGTFRLTGTRWLRPVHYDYPANTNETERLMLSPDGQSQADVDFPADRFLVSVYRSRSAATANLVGIYRKLAPWWLFANFSTDWLMQYGQLFGVPIRWATYPESNKGQLATISSMLKKMGAAGWGAFPEGTNLNLIESKGSATQIPQVIIMEKAEEMCDLLLLGQTLTTKPGANGNRSLGDVHADVRNDRVQQCGEFACDVVSDQLIPAVMRWNYGNADMAPRMKIAADENAEAQAKVERDKVLFFDMGLPVAKDFLYKRHNVPMPESTDDLYDKPEPPAPALGAGPAGVGKPRPKKPGGRDITKVAALGSLSVMDRRSVFDVSALDAPDTLIPREWVVASDLAAAFDPEALAQAVEAARRMAPDDDMALAALLDRVKANHVLLVAGKGQEASLGLVAHAMRCGPQYKVPVLDLTGPIMCDTVAAGDEAGAPLPADVVEALAKMPDEARSYYVERLAGAGVDVSALDSGATATALLDRHAMASGRGGKFKSRAIAAAQAKVRAVLEGKPAFGGQRGHRRIHDFGMPDTAGQWQAVGGRLRHDSILASAARVRKATEVPIDTLNPTQRTVDGEKLIDMMEGGDMAQPTHRLPIVVRKDGRDWLYDGHHRGVKDKLMGKATLRSRVVDLGGVMAKEWGNGEEVQAFDPNQPRDPGGKDGGQWVKQGEGKAGVELRAADVIDSFNDGPIGAYADAQMRGGTLGPDGRFKAFTPATKAKNLSKLADEIEYLKSKDPEAFALAREGDLAERLGFDSYKDIPDEISVWRGHSEGEKSWAVQNVTHNQAVAEKFGESGVVTEFKVRKDDIVFSLSNSVFDEGELIVRSAKLRTVSKKSSNKVNEQRIVSAFKPGDALKFADGGTGKFVAHGMGGSFIAVLPNGSTTYNARLSDLIHDHNP